MRKFVFVFFLAILYSFGSQAAPESPLLVNPYYPEFTQADTQLSRSLMDAALEDEITQYTERRDRLQLLMIEHADDEALLQKNSFVMKRMMDRGMRRMMHSPWLKTSAVGRVADGVKNRLHTEVKYKDLKNIEHKFDFKIAAFQGQAFIQYSGLTKAQLRYDVDRGGTFAMIFQHSLSDMSSIGVETTLTGENKNQFVVLNIVW